MLALPGGQGWSNLGDPHGIAVTSAIQDGRPVGFVVDHGLRWVARIDLEKMAGLPHAAPVLSPAELTPAVTLLDARTNL